MHDNIQDTIRRTQRYWYVDGLTEIAAGLVIFLIGMFFLVLGLTDIGETSPWLVAIGQPAIILLGWWLGGKAVKGLKEHLTYPRTGYVGYPQQKGKQHFQRISLSAGIAIAVALGITLLIPQINENVIPIMTSSLLAIAIVIMANRFGLIRLYVLAGYTCLVGLLTAWLGIPDPFRAAVLFSAYGLGWIVSGAFTLIYYLRSTQPLSREDL